MELLPFIAQINASNIIDKAARTQLSYIVLFAVLCTVGRLMVGHFRPTRFWLVNWLHDAFDAMIYASILVFLIIRPFFVQTFFIPSGSMVQTLQVKDFIVANKFAYRFTEPKVGDIAVFKPPARALNPHMQGQDVDYIKRIVGGPGDVVTIVDDQLYRNGQPIQEPYKVFTRPEFESIDGNGQPTRFIPMLPEERRYKRLDFKLIKYRGEIIPVLIQPDGSVNSTGHTAFDYTFNMADETMIEWIKAQPPAPIPDGKYLMIGDNRYNSQDGRFWGLIDRQQIVAKAEFIWLPFSRMGRVH